MNIEYNSLSLGGPLNAVSSSPDTQNPLIAVGGREVLKIVAIENGVFKERLNLRVGKINRNFGVVDLKWHPMPSEQHLIATAPTNGALVLWNLNKKTGGKMERVFTEHGRTVNKVCWRPTDANTLLSGSQDGTVKLWDIRTPNSSATFECSGEVRDLQFSPHFINYFATGNDSGVVQVWDIRKNTASQKLISAHNGPVLAIDWHPMHNGIIASGGRDRIIKVWDLNSTQKPAYSIQTIAIISTVHWRPSYPNHIATSSHMTDRKVHIWDLKSPYVPVKSFTGHNDTVTGFLWYNGSPDVMVSCSKDSNMIVQSISNAESPKHELPVVALSWNPKNELSVVTEKIARRGPSVITSEPLVGTSNINLYHYLDSLPSEEISGNVNILSMDYLEDYNAVESTSCLSDFDHNTIRYFAENYNLHGKESVAEKCIHNARIAASIGKTHLEKVWQILETLYTSNFLSYHDIDKVVEEKEEEEQASTPSETTHENGSSNDSSHGEKSPKHVKRRMSHKHDNEHESEEVTEDDFEEQSSIHSMLGYFEHGGRDGGITGSYDFDGSDHSSSLPSSSPSLRSMIEINMHQRAFDTLDFEMTPPLHPLLKATPSLTSPSLLSSPQIPTPVLSVASSPNTFVNPILDCSSPILNQLVSGNNLVPGALFEETVTEMLDYYCEQGDIQTCVAICTVLRNYLAVDKVRVLRWYLEYIEILRRLKLFVFATEVVKHCPYDLVNKMNQQFTAVRTSCGKCGRLHQGYKSTCEKCKAKAASCVICQLPVRGDYLWCQRCGHGGHLTHMVAWLRKYKTCPKCNTDLDKFQQIL